MANIGKIVQIVGAVLDIRFEDEKNLPNLLNALEINKENWEDEFYKSWKIDIR